MTENLKITNNSKIPTVQILVWRGLAFYCSPFLSLSFPCLLLFSCSLHLLLSFSSLFSKPCHCFHSHSLPFFFLPSFRRPDKDIDVELLKATNRLLLFEMGTINVWRIQLLIEWPLLLADTASVRPLQSQSFFKLYGKQRPPLQQTQHNVQTPTHANCWDLKRLLFNCLSSPPPHLYSSNLTTAVRIDIALRQWLVWDITSVISIKTHRIRPNDLHIPRCCVGSYSYFAFLDLAEDRTWCSSFEFLY